MPQSRTVGFIWDEGQIFLGIDDQIVTSYTNDMMTISILQSQSGELLGFSYETEDEAGEVVLTRSGSQTEFNK